ncbi:hypothetical protein HJB89_26480 [Rhizobium sp. NZLR8]|nr:hypothetical protein [Rhizobium sp. NZLR8]MBX5160632.1 hypothetical protein [Rhizobium sp. NZLR8]
MPPQIKADNLDRMRSKFSHERHVQSIRYQPRDLVLDRDVGLPLLHVLATQPGDELTPQLGVDALKVRAGNREGNASAEMTKATDVGCDWAIFG